MKPDLQQSDIDMLLGDTPATSCSAAAVGINAVLGVPAPEGAAIPKSGVVSIFSLANAYLHDHHTRAPTCGVPACMVSQNMTPVS